jgi:hypothetical protein
MQTEVDNTLSGPQNRDEVSTIYETDEVQDPVLPTLLDGVKYKLHTAGKAI